VILPDVEIGRYCRIRKAIIDRGTVIEPNTFIGDNSDDDRARGYRVTPSGITLVTPDMVGQKIHFTR
jgi:glucose-1-phosphate adenylyltransferase